MAFGVYAVLAVLAWTTLSDPKFKYATLAILAMFAVRTWSWSRKQEREKDSELSRELEAGARRRDLC